MISVNRTTRETTVRVEIDIATAGPTQINTGIGFFDHMLTTLAHWAGWTLSVQASGDLEIDTHHTIEDVGICLGQALAKSWPSDGAVERIASAYAPLDEVLARAVVDLCNRPVAIVSAEISLPMIGAYPSEMTIHFFRTLATEGRFTLHLDLVRGGNSHHEVEAMFKALALALRGALQPRGKSANSTKGAL